MPVVVGARWGATRTVPADVRARGAPVDGGLGSRRIPRDPVVGHRSRVASPGPFVNVTIGLPARAPRRGRATQCHTEVDGSRGLLRPPWRRGVVEPDRFTWCWSCRPTRGGRHRRSSSAQVDETDHGPSYIGDVKPWRTLGGMSARPNATPWSAGRASTCCARCYQVPRRPSAIRREPRTGQDVSPPSVTSRGPSTCLPARKSSIRTAGPRVPRCGPSLVPARSAAAGVQGASTSAGSAKAGT